MGWIAKRRKERSGFGYLMEQIQAVFSNIADHRRSNASYACKYFRALWKGLGTKAKLWQAIQAAFTMIESPEF